MALIKFLFEIEKKPRKGLLAVEWVIMGYLLLTLLLMFFTRLVGGLQTHTLQIHNSMPHLATAHIVVVVVS